MFRSIPPQNWEGAWDECRYCGHSPDDVERAVLRCGRWNQERQAISTKIGVELSTKNLIKKILDDKYIY